MDDDKCEHCGKPTLEGLRKRAEQYKSNPIYETNFSEPLSKIIQDIRIQLIATRGTLYDIEFAFPGWGEQTKDVEGLITCGIVVLHEVKKRMEKAELYLKTEQQTLQDKE